jgi:hypothetical protein
MTTLHRRRPRRPLPLGLLLALCLPIAACSAGGSATNPGTIVTPIPSPIATGPDVPVSSEPGAGGGGDPGMPGVGKIELTVPKPGQLDVHPVTAQLLEAFVDGRHVTIRVTWTSGVEPCNILDSIGLERGHAAIGIVVREGHAPGNNVCIEIAMQKRALVDLGELDPGTYTISDSTGAAAPIQVVVS